MYRIKQEKIVPKSIIIIKKTNKITYYFISDANQGLCNKKTKTNQEQN